MKTETQPGVEYAQHRLDADDGHRIEVRYWCPTAMPLTGFVQILHGLAEHTDRYQRFAQQLAGAGFAVVAHDHRGHGTSVDPAARGHFADAAGWQRVLDDVGHVRAWIADRHAGTQGVLFGHSMGSYIAQAFVMQNPQAFDALVLSGSTSAPRLSLYLGRFAARIECWLRGRRHPSESLNKQAFGAFNKRFEPARTDFDWLSRDAAEVDKYVTDPACGFIPTAGLWHDLLGGLVSIGKKNNVRKIPAALPILITGGSDDPVGGRKGMERLGASYRATGHDKVTLNIYDDGRHEMLNEINRDEFTAYVMDWILAALADSNSSAGSRS